MQQNNSSALDAVQTLEEAENFTKNALIGITSTMSFVGTRVIVPGSGWEKELWAAGLAVAVYFTIKLLLNSQRAVFPALRRKSRAAIFVLVFSIIAILGTSGSTSLVGLISHKTALLSMQDGKADAELRGGEAKRSIHSVASLSTLLLTFKDKSQDLSKRAISGHLTGTAGYGPVAKRYESIANELSGLVNMLDEIASKADPIMSSMDAAASRMGGIIKQEISIEDKVPQFEMAHRDYTNNSNRLIGFNVADQIRSGLSSLADTAIAESAADRTSQKALYAAEEFVQNISNDINNYLETNLEPLSIMEVYKHPSPSISTFTYAFNFIPQVALAFSPDIALIILLILRIIAAHDAIDAVDDNPKIDLTQLDLLAGAVSKILELRSDKPDDAHRVK
jgi:hypothetical protein